MTTGYAIDLMWVVQFVLYTVKVVLYSRKSGKSVVCRSIVVAYLGQSTLIRKALACMDPIACSKQDLGIELVQIFELKFLTFLKNAFCHMTLVK